MLAHGTGLDDLIVAVAVLATFLLLPGRGRQGPATDDGACAYCDVQLEDDERCATCGFRVTRSARGGGS